MVGCFAVHAAQHYGPEQHSAVLSNLNLKNKITVSK